MLAPLSIKELYAYSVAEGGGAGLAYAYFVKRLLFASWLRQVGFRPKSEPPIQLLIAGLPATRGTGLDLLLLAEELGATPLVIDEDAAALARLTNSLETAQRLGLLQSVRFKGLVVNDMGVIWEAASDFDLIISDNVLQRLDPATGRDYVQHLSQIGLHLAIICPNKHNTAYLHQQGVNGLDLDRLTALMNVPAYRSGLMAMPPFGSSLSLSTLANEKTISERLQTVAFLALQIAAWLERFTPTEFQKSSARLVYALSAIR